MVTTYTKKQFIDDVKKEARALRENATPEELLQLDFDTLDPHSGYHCIYGQMTGNCTSKRAHELISKCCVAVIDFEEFTYCDTEDAANNARSLKPTINWLADRRDKHNIKYISSIEAYIMLDSGAQNKNLIQYLKGERNDLVL